MTSTTPDVRTTVPNNTAPFNWVFALRLAIFFFLSRLRFLHGLLPPRIREELPMGWNYKMFWTAFSTGGNKIYFDLYCRTKEPKNYKAKAKVKIPDFQLTEEQIRFFHENGYVGPFDLLSSDEVNELREYCFDVLNTDSQVIREGDYYFQDGKKQSALLGGYDELSDEAKSYFLKRLNLVDRHLDSPKLLQLIKRPEIIERCAQILGENLITWRSQFFTKEAHKDGTPWHQANVWLFDDFKEPIVHLADVEELSQLTFWVAVTDVDKKSGCMKVIPGSHKEIYPINIDHSGINSLYGFIGGSIDYPTESSPVDYIEMKAGQFFLFSERVIHGSVPNSTDDFGLAINCRVTRTDTQIHNQEVLKKGAFSIDIYGMDLGLKNWGAVLLRGKDEYGLNRLFNNNEEN